MNDREHLFSTAQKQDLSIDTVSPVLPLSWLLTVAWVDPLVVMASLSSSCTSSLVAFQQTWASYTACSVTRLLWASYTSFAVSSVRRCHWTARCFGHRCSRSRDWRASARTRPPLLPSVATVEHAKGFSHHCSHLAGERACVRFRPPVPLVAMV